MKLQDEKCVSINASSKPLTKDEIDKLLLQVEGWDLKEVEGENRLRRTFKFKDFKEALAFTDRVGEIADREDHHPAILTEYGKVTVDWWTHKIKGLHGNDFIMAAKTTALI